MGRSLYGNRPSGEAAAPNRCGRCAEVDPNRRWDHWIGDFGNEGEFRGHVAGTWPDHVDELCAQWRRMWHQWRGEGSRDAREFRRAYFARLRKWTDDPWECNFRQLQANGECTPETVTRLAREMLTGDALRAVLERCRQWRSALDARSFEVRPVPAHPGPQDYAAGDARREEAS